MGTMVAGAIHQPYGSNGRVYNVIERRKQRNVKMLKLIGTFHDGESALMLVCARLRYIVSNDWCKRHYLEHEASITDMLCRRTLLRSKNM